MREIGPIRKRLRGGGSERYIGPARVLLGQMKDYMKAFGVKQLRRRHIIDGDVHIEVGSIFGQDFIKIETGEDLLGAVKSIFVASPIDGTKNPLAASILDPRTTFADWWNPLVSWIRNSVWSFGRAADPAGRGEQNWWNTNGRTVLSWEWTGTHRYAIGRNRPPYDVAKLYTHPFHYIFNNLTVVGQLPFAHAAHVLGAAVFNNWMLVATPGGIFYGLATSGTPITSWTLVAGTDALDYDYDVNEAIELNKLYFPVFFSGTGAKAVFVRHVNDLTESDPELYGTGTRVEFTFTDEESSVTAEYTETEINTSLHMKVSAVLATACVNGTVTGALSETSAEFAADYIEEELTFATLRAASASYNYIETYSSDGHLQVNTTTNAVNNNQIDLYIGEQFIDVARSVGGDTDRSADYNGQFGPNWASVHEQTVQNLYTASTISIWAMDIRTSSVCFEKFTKHDNRNVDITYTNEFAGESYSGGCVYTINYSRDLRFSPKGATAFVVDGLEPITSVTNYVEDPGCFTVSRSAPDYPNSPCTEWGVSGSGNFFDPDRVGEILWSFNAGDLDGFDEETPHSAVEKEGSVLLTGELTGYETTGAKTFHLVLDGEEKYDLSELWDFDSESGDMLRPGLINNRPPN